MRAPAATSDYDPTRDGARCDLCALRKLRAGGPVPSEFHRGAVGCVVAEAPGQDEVYQSRPLCGSSGQEYEKALTTLGRPRKTLHLINSLACRPPGNDLAAVMARLKSLNDDREDAGLEKLPSPLQCCRPRLEADLQRAERTSPRSSGRVIAMGKIALQALTGRASKILDIRGAPLLNAPDGSVGFGRWIMPIPHAAFVLRARRWTKVFRSDIGKAIRWFESGKLGWVPPRKLSRPTPSQLRRWLLDMPSQWRAESNDYSAVIYDTETTMEGGPMWNRLRCTGFGKLDLDGEGVGVLFVPVLSVDGVTRFYSQRDEDEIREIEREFFSRADIEKWGWNSGYFDELIKGEYLAVDPTRRVDGARLRPFKDFKNRNDGILVHRGVESELPHRLGFAGSAYTIVPGAWKEAHTAKEASSDAELEDYNANKDVPITARIIPPLLEAASLRDQMEVVRKDYRLQEVAKGIHRNGLPVHEPTRLEWEVKLRAEAGERDETTGYVPGGTLLKKLCDIAGDDDLNPRSTQQLRRLIFKRWGLTPAMDPMGDKPLLTKSGYPSTSNAAILELRRRGDCGPREIEFIDTLRRYRKKSKLLATYVLPLRPDFVPRSEDLALDLAGDDDALDDLDGLTLTEDGEIVPRSYIDPSGGALDDDRDDSREGRVTLASRVHPSVNVHTPKTGRFSMTRPPAQTFTRELRNIFRARPGWKFVICDKDQIELRHFCARANAKRYLEVFAEPKSKRQLPDGTWEIKGDPHSLSAAQIFGERFTRLWPECPKHKTRVATCELCKSSENFEKLRDFVKRDVYATIYKAEAATIHRVITSAENTEGVLLYPNMTLLEVAELRSNWITQNPEVEPWWQEEINEYRRNGGWRREIIWGRRCDFLDGEDENEITNFDEQSGCAAILWDDTFALLDAVPFEKWGPWSGLVHTEHDKSIVECPADAAEWTRGVVNEAMNRAVPQIPNVKFTAKPKICDTLRGD